MIKLNIYYPAVKRALDIFGSCLLLIITSPLTLTTAFLIRINLGKPVFFSQLRPGLHGQIFRLYKFRTMRNSDISTGLVSDEARMTKFGKVLRSLSLDELPSLWNVLIGELSFIGPRPLLTEYLEFYTKEEASRHSVRPGITGLAQCSGRNLLTWEEKFAYDIEYVEKISFILDCKILLKTVCKVAQREGIDSVGETTAKPLTDFRKTN